MRRPRAASPRAASTASPGVAWHARPSGPALDDAVAWVECTIDATYVAGDHLIVVGAVDEPRDRAGAGAPLVFFRGRYGSFAEPDQAED